jgi:hypothetical protein
MHRHGTRWCMNWTPRLQAYLKDVEERLAEIVKMIAQVKDLIAKSTVGSAERWKAEQRLAVYHEEGRFLMAQRERVRHMLAQVQQQEQLPKVEVSSDKKKYERNGFAAPVFHPYPQGAANERRHLPGRPGRDRDVHSLLLRPSLKEVVMADITSSPVRR